MPRQQSRPHWVGLVARPRPGEISRAVCVQVADDPNPLPVRPRARIRKAKTGIVGGGLVEQGPIQPRTRTVDGCREQAMDAASVEVCKVDTVSEIAICEDDLGIWLCRSIVRSASQSSGAKRFSLGAPGTRLRGCRRNLLALLRCGGLSLTGTPQSCKPSPSVSVDSVQP